MGAVGIPSKSHDSLKEEVVVHEDMGVDQNDTCHMGKVAHGHLGAGNILLPIKTSRISRLQLPWTQGFEFAAEGERREYQHQGRSLASAPPIPFIEVCTRSGLVDQSIDRVPQRSPVGRAL